MSKEELPKEEQPNENEGPLKKYKFDFDNEEVPGAPLSKEIDKIDKADLDRINELAAAWHEKYPNGLPSFKRPAPWRNYINTAEIMLLGRCSLRTAQRWLQNTRDFLNLKKNALVKVSEFCQVNEKFREEDVREFLNALDAADYEER